MNYEFYVNINISEMLNTGLKNYDVLIGQNDWLNKRLVGFSKKIRRAQRTGKTLAIKGVGANDL